MKTLTIILFLLTSLESFAQLDNAKSISKALRQQNRSTSLKKVLTSPSIGWYRINNETKELLQIQEINKDTIINYVYLNNELVRVDFGFRKIYALYFFKDGGLIDKIERKKWHIDNIHSYRQKGEKFLTTLANR